MIVAVTEGFSINPEHISAIYKGDDEGMPRIIVMMNNGYRFFFDIENTVSNVTMACLGSSLVEPLIL